MALTPVVLIVFIRNLSECISSIISIIYLNITKMSYNYYEISIS